QPGPRHAGPPASAYRPADRQLAVPGPGAAPGQPRQQAAGQAGRAEPDDRRPGHRALGGIGGRTAFAAARPAAVDRAAGIPAARRTVFRAPRRPPGGARGRGERDRGRRRVRGGALAGFEVAVPGGDDFVLPVREDFEYGVVAVDGSAVVAGALIAPGLLAHLPAGRSRIQLSPAGGRRLARFFVVGGVPFGERLLMWWNFVARSGQEIAKARADWAAGGFGEVRGY